MICEVYINAKAIRKLLLTSILTLIFDFHVDTNASVIGCDSLALTFGIREANERFRVHTLKY